MLTYCSKYVMEVCLFVYYVLFMCVKSSVSATRQHQINESSLKKLWWLNNSLLASTFFFYRSPNLFSSFKSRLSERMSCKNQKCRLHLQIFPILISLITVKVGINVEGCKSCKTNWTFSINFYARINIYSSK